MTPIQFARRSNSLIWDYFVRNHESKIAECNICNKHISYKTTITNLKQHLKLKHISALNEFLSRSTSTSVKKLEREEVSSETRYSSEPEIEYLEEPVQNEHDDLYLISSAGSFNMPPDSHFVEIKSIGSSQSKSYHRVSTPATSTPRKNVRNVPKKSVESLRRIYFMKKCSNLLLERRKLMRELENQKEEHNLKVMILQKTLNNLNKV